MCYNEGERSGVDASCGEMKIVLGADHGGYLLKEAVKAFLEGQGYAVEDMGTFDQESCDYPDYGERVARAVCREEACGRDCRGIVVCGTGIGISIAANKVKGIRAALCGDTFSARMSRCHNDANVLALGQRVVGQGLALDIVEAWLTTSFEGGRHATRLGKLMAIEASAEEAESAESAESAKSATYGCGR